MPFYDRRCDKCGDFEEFALIKDRDKIKCPKCGKKSKPLLGASSVKGDPTTIGSLADKNTKKMGHYEREARELADGMPQKKAAREEYDNIRKLANMTPQQKERYIYEGKMPSR